MKIQGDLEVCRTVTSKRSDEALRAATLAADEQIVRHSEHWQYLDPDGADREVELPDATNLPVGWKVVVNHSGSADVLNVREYNATPFTGTILRAEQAGEACEFTLLDKSTAAGVWFVSCFVDPSVAAAARFVANFVTGDFPAAAGGYQTLTSSEVAGFAASAHGRGVTPVYNLFEGVSGGDLDRIFADRERFNSSGDFELRVAEGCTFDGCVVFI